MAASNDPQLNNKYMEYVVALAQHQTISAAAEAMFISQPAMSHFIRSLENRLGVKLFNRVRNRYIPTYEGERYLFYARRIIALETQMRNEFAEIRVAGHGQIRLALPTLRSAYILPSLVPAYRRLYPNVKLVTLEAHSQVLEKMLLSGEADFAILNSPAKNSDTTSLFIRRDEILLAVPPAQPAGMHQFSASPGSGEMRTSSGHFSAPGGAASAARTAPLTPLISAFSGRTASSSNIRTSGPARPPTISCRMWESSPMW